MLFVLFESARSAVMSIYAHGLRSFLTTLGIVIGVASVIAVVSISQGMRMFVSDRFASLGSNGVTITSFTSTDDFLKGIRSRLTQEDLSLIERRGEGIASITPLLYANRASRIRYGSQTTFSQIQGTTYAYQDTFQHYAAIGRFLAPSDNETRRRVVVIGDKTRDNLGLPENPVNEYVEVGGEWFKIVGLLETKGEIMGFNQDDLLLMPFATMQSLQGNQVLTDIQIRLNFTESVDADDAVQRMTSLLRNSRGLGPGEDNDFIIQTSEELMETFDSIIGTMTVVVGGIVGISLLVGGIGIMNIMLVSVTERTREIGICKAIGAKRHHILMQFLIEAMLLSLLGGVFGLVIGYGLGTLIAGMIPGFPPSAIPWWSIMLALGFSTLVGMVFGILPAARAANLDPIDALRYE